jgi:phosphate transport system substrate-binding protein
LLHAGVVLAFGVLLLSAEQLHSAQGGAAKADISGKLVLAGSSTMMPLVTEMAKRFEALHRSVKIEVHSGGSGKGISDLRSSACDIAMVSRALLAPERDLFAFPIARDGVALIAHLENPVAGLTAHQMADLLTGKITNWKAFRGRDAQVVLIWRGKGQGSVEFLLERLNLTHADIRPQATIVENDAVINEVANNRQAIAPVSVGEAERKARSGLAIKLLAFDGVASSSRTIRNGSYSMARPLVLVTRQLPQGLEKQFIGFALSGHVSDLFVKHDFVAYQE